MKLVDIKRTAMAVLADQDKTESVQSWQISDLLEAAYYAGREDAVSEMKYHIGELTEQRLSVEHGIRLSKQNKRGERA